MMAYPVGLLIGLRQQGPMARVIGLFYCYHSKSLVLWLCSGTHVLVAPSQHFPSYVQSAPTANF